jgi:hypothetical protein
VTDDEFTPEPLMTHGQYEQRNPDDAAQEGIYEQTRRHRFVASRGSLDGYRPAREFPCSGVLQIVERSDSHETVQCSTCRFETTIRRRGREPADARADW